MGKKGGISWEPVEKGDGLVAVDCRVVVPLARLDETVRELHSVCLGERVERPAPQKPLPPVFTTNNRSFGRLPPGVYPHWQRREWRIFILWAIAVIAILAAAVRRNASHLF